jgi:hypothetical protein
MNPGQLYECYFNRSSEIIRSRIINGQVEHPFNYIVEYFNDINPNYAKLTRQIYATKTDRDKFVNSCITDGIYLNIPPGLNTINTKLVRYIRDKYDIKISPVTFNVLRKDGTKKIVRTKKDVCIGSKYIYLLYKMPEPSASGMGYINQYKTPIRPSSEARKSHPISQTAIRQGEDEFRILIEGLLDKSEAMRLACVQANSPQGVDLLMETMLTAPKPSRINRVKMTTAELIETNTIIGIVHHMISTLGIDSRNVNCKPLDMMNIETYFGVQNDNK